MLKSTLENIFNLKLNEIERTQASLPICMGGLGVRTLSQIALPAFVSCMYGFEPMVTSMLHNQGIQRFKFYSNEAELEWALTNVCPIASNKHL